jgi:Fe-S-cluster containining protein
MPDTAPFPCNGCARCCRKIAQAVAFAKEAGFPYTWDAQGVCEMLTPGNKCKVYDTRPTLCSVEKMYEYIKNYFKEKGQSIDYDTYIEYNIHACMEL